MKKLLVGISLMLMQSHAQPPALPNLGNSCYMNAALQCLLNVKDFTDFFKNTISQPTTRVVTLYQNYVKNPTQENLAELYFEVQIEIDHASFITWLNTVLYNAFLVTPFDIPALKNIKKLIAQEMKNPARKSFEKKFLKAIFKDINKIQGKVKAFEQSVKNVQNLAGDIGFVSLIPDTSKIEDIKKQLVQEPFKQFAQQKNTIFEIEFRNALKKSPQCGQQDINELMTRLLEIFMKDGLVGSAIQKKIEFVQYDNFIECGSYTTAPKDITKQSNLLLIVGLWNDALQDVNPSLQACLDYTIFSELSDYKVEGVVQAQCTKKNLFEDLADYLIISLNRRRIALDEYGNIQDIKLSNSISIPLQFDMTPYIAPAEQGMFNPVYELTSVAVHSGGTGGGHYIAYVKDQSDQNWYECNDDIITKMDDATAQLAVEQGYIFFYKRMSDTLAKKFLLQQQILVSQTKNSTTKRLTKLAQSLSSLG